MEVKRKLDWKDDWIDESQAPITEMFYKVFGHLPIQKELRSMIDIFIITKSNKEVREKWRQFCNEKETRRGQTNSD